MPQRHHHTEKVHFFFQRQTLVVLAWIDPTALNLGSNLLVRTWSIAVLQPSDKVSNKFVHCHFSCLKTGTMDVMLILTPYEMCSPQIKVEQIDHSACGPTFNLGNLVAKHHRGQFLAYALTSNLK